MTYTTRKGTYLSLDLPHGKDKLDMALNWLADMFRFRAIEPALRVNNEIDEYGPYQYLSIELDIPEWGKEQIDELIQYYKDTFLH